MRHFYLFRINPTIVTVLKNNPYELFRALQTIYFREPDDFMFGNVFIKQLLLPIKIRDLDIELFKQFKTNYFYMKYQNRHSMHDVYRKETTILSLHKTYLQLDTNVIKPKFLNVLRTYPGFFVCDFIEKDYFWLDELEREVVAT